MSTRDRVDHEPVSVRDNAGAVMWIVHQQSIEQLSGRRATAVPTEVKIPMSGTGMASGGTFIQCAWHRGCGAIYQGSRFTNTRGARKEARADGWLITKRVAVVLVAIGRHDWTTAPSTPHANANDAELYKARINATVSA
jgi:hypothetical protein